MALHALGNGGRDGDLLPRPTEAPVSVPLRVAGWGTTATAQDKAEGTAPPPAVRTSPPTPSASSAPAPSTGTTQPAASPSPSVPFYKQLFSAKRYQLFGELGHQFFYKTPIQLQDPDQALLEGQTVVPTGTRVYPWSTPFGQDEGLPPAAILGSDEGLTLLRLGVQFNQTVPDGQVGLHIALFVEAPFGNETYTLSRGNGQAILDSLKYKDSTVAIDSDGDGVADENASVNYQTAYQPYINNSSLTIARQLLGDPFYKGIELRARVGCNIGRFTPYFGFGLPTSRYVNGTNLFVDRTYKIDPVTPTTYDTDGNPNLDNLVKEPVQVENYVQTVMPLAFGGNLSLGKNLGKYFYLGGEVTTDFLLGDPSTHQLSASNNVGDFLVNMAERTSLNFYFGGRLPTFEQIHNFFEERAQKREQQEQQTKMEQK